MGAAATLTGRRASALESVRSAVFGWPRVYLPLVRSPLAPGWRHRRRLALGRDTEVVIEGYPRSGNSFAVVAFELAQDRPVSVAHHLHAPAQVIAAVRRGIPALVVARDPHDAVVSRLVRRPALDPVVAYRQYVAYHRRLLPWAHGFEVTEFEEVISDFGRAISRLNRRFGTTYRPFEHSEENVARCFEILDRVAENEGPDGAGLRSGRPSEARRLLQDEARARVEADPAARGPVVAAAEIHQRFRRLVSG